MPGKSLLIYHVTQLQASKLHAHCLVVIVWCQTSAAGSPPLVCCAGNFKVGRHTLFRGAWQNAMPQVHDVPTRTEQYGAKLL